MDWKNVQYKDGKYKTAEGGSGGSSTFAGLDDVDFSNVQNGQVPKYNSATQKWENADESGGGGTVTDVKVDGQSVVDPQTGEANITMPTPPTIPVVGVKVNGVSVVDSNKEAQIKSYKEVTQAEYNALPSSKLNDGVLYAIKDAGGADSMPPIIYSDEEREVGVWRDGKPLYQKTIISDYTFHTTQTIGIAIDVHDLNIDTPVAIDGFWRRWAGDGNKLWYQYGSEESTYGIGWARIDSENNYPNGRLMIKIHSDGTDLQIVTLQYTKTTDTPGSGIWNQQGCYAHHYSTTEQVVGTWIDGKPLYQKTIITDQLPNNEMKNIPHNISNIDKIVNIEAVTHAKLSVDANNTFTSVPRIQDNNTTNANMGLDVTATNIVLKGRSSSVNFSSIYEYVIVTLLYTKTTD